MLEPASALWEEAADCGVCGSPERVPAWSIAGRRFVVCARCGVTRLFDRVAEGRLDLLYADYYPDDDPIPEALEAALRNPTFAARRKRLEAHLDDRPRRLLEIGCGDGNFLASMRRAGWLVQGSEFGEESGRRVERRHGIDVFTGPIERLAPAQPFPVVAAYHVLEHVYHPAEWLRFVRALVEPRGLLHLQVPNVASLTRRATGEAWASLVFPQHVYLYSPATLTRLLQQAGFSIREAGTWDPWHGPGALAGSVANAITMRATGRSPWSADLGCQSRAHVYRLGATRSRSLRSALRRVLDAASGPLSRLEAVVGRGAVVDVVAERTRPIP